MRRQQAWNFDPQGEIDSAGVLTYSNLISNSNLNLLWKSYIFNKTNAARAAPITAQGVFQVAITAQIYLRHLHSFFERVPLLKGVL